jgi:hypothetical protein
MGLFSRVGTSEEGARSAVDRLSHELRAERHARHALSDSKRHLRRKALEAALYVVLAFLLLRLVPSLELAFKSLGRVSWEWIVGAVLLELVSELGFVYAWREIVDPQRVLERDGRGERVADRVAWAQLGGGLVVPGGSYGGMGVGGLILHRFGMATDLIARRQFNLSFLNTAVSALALIVFGVGLATGLFSGEPNLLLTLLPAALAVMGMAAALAIALHMASYAERLRPKHPKGAGVITALANAVGDTKLLVVGRRHPILIAAIVYLLFEVLVLWSAFLAVHANPVPGFPLVVMAYVIGALGGSLPLPAAIGTVGGVAGMLVLYGVDHNPAVAAVLLHQAIGMLVPLTGGAIAYTLLRRRLGPLRPSTAEGSPT